jgi:hypothetical protein
LINNKISIYKKFIQSSVLFKIFFLYSFSWIIVGLFFFYKVFIYKEKEFTLEEPAETEENTEEPINVNTTEFENIANDFSINLGEVYSADIDNRSIIIKVDSDLIEIDEDILYLYLREYTNPNSYIERRLRIDHLIEGEKVLLLDETGKNSQKTFKKVVVLKGNYSQENIDNMFM